MRQLFRSLILLMGVIILVSSVNFSIARQDTPQAWLYFSDTLGGLFRMSPDGSIVETLIENMVVDKRILWSEDGQWLYFSGYDYTVGPPMLFRFNVYRQQLEPLMESGGRPRPWSWSPDGEWLLVNDDYGAGLNFLVMMRPDGSDTHSPIPDVSYSLFVDWSPDSQWLFFEAFFESSADLYRVRLDGSDLKNLTQRAEADTHGSITPDGEWILYLSLNGYDSDVFRMRPDGSDKQNLTNTPDYSEVHYILSPGGTWVVTRRGNDLVRMRVDGTDGLQITDFGSTLPVNYYSTQWSPDGAWLYIEGGHAHEAEIFRVHVVSGELEQLTDNGVFNTFQQLSTDGRWMIYTSGLADGTGELRVMDVETGPSTLLAAFPHWLEIGDLSPDGDWYYFTLPDDDLVLQLYRVRLDGTELEKLTDSDGDVSFLTWSQPLEKT